MAPSRHQLHEGELFLQKKRHTPSEVGRGLPHYIKTDMPAQHARFYAALSYLPLATLDEQGRPWASVSVVKSDDDPSIGIRIPHPSELILRTRMSADDPFHRAVRTAANRPETEPLFAGVGIDFSTRSRTKLAGSIHSADVTEPGMLQLHLKSDAHLGNCPKYITVRALAPQTRQPETSLNQPDSFDGRLPQECRDHINRVSTVFLATKHIPDEGDSTSARVGLNHRGGHPGFVRVHEQPGNEGDGSPAENSTTYLVLPDYSGNRFYQSLGNVQSTRLVGLSFPDFASGDMLWITGDAENLFDEEAAALMPRTSLVTRIRVTGVVYIKGALDLKLTSEEHVSPYNPPLRYLQQELADIGYEMAQSETPLRATLVSAKGRTIDVGTFTFRLSSAIAGPPPGAFGVFDFSEILSPGYLHMNEAHPQSVNDDFVRTWTISSASTWDPASRRFAPVDTIDVTVKRTPNGAVSNVLHGLAVAMGEDPNLEIDLPLNGTGGLFSCFDQTSSTALVPERMLWLAGGIGITPFMSMWDGLLKSHAAMANSGETLSTDIVLLFAARDDDLQLLDHFMNDLDSLPDSISFHIMAFQTNSDMRGGTGIEFPDAPPPFRKPFLELHRRRLSGSDLSTVARLAERDVFLCGPDQLMETAQDWLEDMQVAAENIHRESFNF